MTALLIFGGLILLLLTGVPIFAALGLAGTAILIVFEGGIGSVADPIFSSLNKSILVAIPLFVLMAQVMLRAKIIDDLYDMAHTMLGHIRGGLSVATVMACTIFAAISGSSVATALSVGSSAIPQMERFGYPRRAALGIVAAGGTLGILIPPSGPMILYAVVSEASIGALFLAGIIPGLMLAAIFSVYAMVSATSRGAERPAFAGMANIARALRKSVWALLAPPVVLGGIYTGIFTASEAAAVGCLYAIVVAVVVYRNFGLADLWQALRDTTRTSMMVFAIIAAAHVFGYAITIIRLPVGITEVVAAAGLGRVGFMIIVMLMLFVMGMFFDAIAIILITTPILLPTIIALDINLVWYGVMLMINLELAMITPPVGMNLFVIKGITDSPLTEVVKGAAPYVVLMLLGLVILMVFPELATWLPDTAGYNR